ncbi:MAG: tRNA pseudouridine(55) synthase TruB [Spirochaetes bacterium RBG_16_49_21]|nr:MAG: tRNA pseudouridine(55) synthase TruB [Spirochaetes bacterium RBG_16_49_21]
MNAVLLIDKPEGKTSHETVMEVKRLTGADKIGHSGTLDRFASGLLIHCTGPSTKLARFLLEDDKTYTGTMRLGKSTDTHDREGAVIEEKPVCAVTREEIMDAAGRFKGKILQVPPRFSALKINGKRASDRARDGESVELAGRMVTIYEFGIYDIDLDAARFRFQVRCSKGTYIRSIARDMGRILGTGAYLEALRRTGSGLFSIDQAVTISTLNDYLGGAPVNKSFIVRPIEALKNYGMIVVTESSRRRILNGACFDIEGAVKIIDKGEKLFIIADEDQNLIAIAEMDIKKWQIKYLNVFK